MEAELVQFYGLMAHMQDNVSFLFNFVGKFVEIMNKLLFIPSSASLASRQFHEREKRHCNPCETLLGHQ